MSTRKKIFKGSSDLIIINEDGTINDEALINSIPTTNTITKQSSTSTKSSTEPSITNYHQGEMIDFETYLDIKPSEESIDHQEEETINKQLEEENDRKIQELMKKKNIKLSHNYKPFFENKKE
ncbi:predicted protein [Naegleria gruberi]|uniref:Predicted protein n=1 Tax=Naegleria gruberi TaxID=5762 RepID=D2VAH5_NAEGR|nr:uncharacterized protein NAEGRDRAFT_47965 [Naegleria gruberi]EFC46074.1 predicted protein [Naegleria gruberi]|eukprot:XP_002678818.1 predicted protein [Naegleria gruberi strain NEG-M]